MMALARASFHGAIPSPPTALNLPDAPAGVGALPPVTVHRKKSKKNAIPSIVAQAQAAAAEGGVRLKRLTNTDNVFTLTKTADGDKFRCKECSRCFNLKCTLLRHVRHQHQGRFVPHPCPQCGQVFKRTDHLKVHLKKIHNVETVSRAHNAGGATGSSGEHPPMPPLTPSPDAAELAEVSVGEVAIGEQQD